MEFAIKNSHYFYLCPMENATAFELDTQLGGSWIVNVETKVNIKSYINS